jgi:hypothetical protein
MPSVAVLESAMMIAEGSRSPFMTLVAWRCGVEQQSRSNASWEDLATSERRGFAKETSSTGSSVVP